MEKDLGQIFNELKDDVSTFVELKFELLKLNTYERIGKLVSILSYGLVLAALGFFALLFLFLGLGFLLGEWLNSVSAGMAIVGGVYILFIGILIMSKSWFSTRIMNLIIDALDGDDNNNETDYEREIDANREADL